MNSMQSPKLSYLIILLFFFWLTPYQEALSGNSSKMEYPVIRGERPPIDLNKVTPDMIEPGRLRIKIHPEAEQLFPVREIIAQDGNFVSVGRTSVDLLMQRYKVTRLKPSFEELYNTHSRTTDYLSRHRAWGFHLWYELTIESDDVLGAVREFMALPEVSFAEPEYKKILVIADPWMNSPEPVMLPSGGRNSDWTPSDPQYPDQWHYNNTGQNGGTPNCDIRLQQAWDIQKGNPNVIVAVIDGGIDYTHPDLAANMWENLGYNFYYGTPNLSPINHGTHVAGTIAAVTNNSIGVAGIAGGNGTGNGVRLMSCQVFISNTGAQNIHLAFIYAADNGACIAQNSWGYTSPDVYEQIILDAIDYFNVNGGGTALSGGITIFSAGNSNSSGNYYPGYYSGTFAVAATNNQDQKAYYSNFGTWIDISAPGGETNVVTQRGVLSTLMGSSYGYYQGTSMAAPHVSGVAALIISEGFGQLTAVQVANVLKNSATNHYGVNPGYIGMLGSGRLNAYNALILLQNILPVPNPTNFTVSAVSDNQIDLQWTKNSQNHDVMIIWSLNGLLGTPQNGIIYQPGDDIPGGGKVLYSGSGTTFQHTGLNHSTTYYYRIFSYNSQRQYSSGVSGSAMTLCTLLSTLPFTENFEASQFLPACWEIIDNQGNNQVWKIGSFTGGLPSSFGNYAYLNSDMYGPGNSQNSDLITPVFDFTYYTNVTLKFSHFYRHYTGTSASLAYSLNNGATWTTIQTWTATTANPATFNQVIQALAGQPQVRFRWKYTGTWGYYWCVDNIEVSGTYNGPVINFSASSTQITIGQSVVFTDLSSNGNFTSWQWHFGEGAHPQTLTGQGPHTVQYLTTGNKTVTLIVNGKFTHTKQNYIEVLPKIYQQSNTYQAGDISTDRNFTALPGASACPGTLSVTVPSQAQIVRTDVTYKMTAIGSARINQQRSQLRCISAGGLSEPTLTQGTINAAGTFTYTRQNLDIANNVTGGGNIVFQLHAGRTSLGSGCNTLYNKVDNNSWTVTVYYTLNENYQTDFTANTNQICQSQSVQFSAVNFTPPTAYLWEFQGGNPSVSNLANPVINYPQAGTFAVTLTVWFGETTVVINKPNYITVNPLPARAGMPSGLTSVCQGIPSSTYNTSGATHAISYQWLLEPAAAGTLSGSGTQVTINWNAAFSGQAQISVSGVNPCGQGIFSDPLIINVNPLPGAAATITGNTEACQGDTSYYQVPLVPHATQYQWQLSPSYAGVIVPLNHECQIIWDESFIGIATLKVRGVNNCGQGEWSPPAEIQVSTCPPPPVPPSGWEFVPTSVSMTVWISSSAVISIYGNIPETGSWLGVFFRDHNNLEKCGGAVYFTPGQTLVMTVYGDDPTTGGKEGFAMGETLNWKIYDLNTQQSYLAAATYQPDFPGPHGIFGTGHNVVIRLEALQQMVFHLPEGWSGFSLPFKPVPSQVEQLFSGIVNQLVIVRNNEYLYWPGQNINTFPEWQHHFGAQLKMLSHASIPISGIPQGTSINLNPGWNFLPVLSACDVSLNELAISPASSVEILKEIAGMQMYWPDMGIQTLTTLKPGVAYMIRLREAAMINFPLCLPDSQNLPGY